MISIHRTIRNAFAGLALAVAAASGAHASTVNVEINGDIFAISTFTGAAIEPSNQTLLEAQPWWGNGELATAFSFAVDDQLGTPNFPGREPYFAFGYSGGDIFNGAQVIANAFAPLTVNAFQADLTYATASLASPPAPIPLPPAAFLLLGGLGALGLVKRRRA